MRNKTINTMLKRFAALTWILVLVVSAGATTISSSIATFTTPVQLTSSLNNVVYIDSDLSFSAAITKAHNLCGSGTCTIYFPGNNYNVDSAVDVRSNTNYVGLGTTLTLSSDIQALKCSSGSINNIRIEGIRFLDDDISTLRSEQFIDFLLCDSENIIINNNEFINRSWTAIRAGSETNYTNNYRITNNRFIGTRKALGYEGDNLVFSNNYLTATGTVGAAAEREGIDYNNPSNKGIGKGVISNNIVINFTEQGLDVNVPGVVITGNVIKLRTDAATTTGINSYANYGGVVSNNIIELSTESTDKGIKVYNGGSGDERNLGQIVSNNRIIGGGAGEGIQVLGNNTLISNNYIQNTTNAIQIREDNNQVYGNFFSNNDYDINDTGQGNDGLIVHDLTSYFYMSDDNINIDIDSDATTQTALRVTADGGGDVVSFRTSVNDYYIKGAVNTATPSHFFFRNLGSASTAAPLMIIEQDNAGDDQNALKVQQDGTGNAIRAEQNGANTAIRIAGGSCAAGQYGLYESGNDLYYCKSGVSTKLN